MLDLWSPSECSSHRRHNQPDDMRKLRFLRIMIGYANERAADADQADVFTAGRPGLPATGSGA